MGDGLYRAAGFALQELPRHLRNGVGNNGSLVTVRLPAPDALRLAQIIEERADAPIKVVEVERAPSRFDWLLWTFVLASAASMMLTDPAGVLAAYFTGLFGG